MTRFLRDNLFFLAVFLLIGAAFVLLRTDGAEFASLEAFQGMLGGGTPTVVEFYSNT